MQFVGDSVHFMHDPTRELTPAQMVTEKPGVVHELFVADVTARAAADCREAAGHEADLDYMPANAQGAQPITRRARPHRQSSDR